MIAGAGLASGTTFIRKGTIMQALQLLFTSDFGLLTVAFFVAMLLMAAVFIKIFSTAR